MSNKITLATIQFRADTKGVNPALDAMRQSSKDAHDEVDRLQEALDKGIKRMKDANGVEFDVADKFRQAQKAAKSYDQALRELVKGATALETVVQNIRLGEIEKSSRAELKGAINAAEARKRSVRETDPEDLQQQRELNQVIEESRKQLNNLDRDTQKVIETLDKGGVVAQATLDKEINGLKEILTLIPKGTDEWNKYNQQLTQMEAHVANIRRQEREAAVSVLGSKDFGRYSEEEIRTAITNARELLATYKTASLEAKALAENIVRADQYLKEHGIEAAKESAKQQQTIKQERQLHMLMNARLKDLTTLSADALEETRKYWQAQRDGAEASSYAFRKAKKSLQEINAEQDARNRKQLTQTAGRLKQQDLSTLSEDELNQAIKAGKELVASMKPADKGYQQLIDNIIRAEKHVKQFGLEGERSNRKAAEQMQIMVDRMARLSSLSDGALQETRKFWQEQMDGAERGSDAYKEAAKNLKTIADEQTRLTNEQNKTQATRLLNKGNLQTMSEGEIRKSIEAAKLYQQTLSTSDAMYQRLSVAIVDAEEHIKEYGIESERTARKEAAAQKLLDDKHRMMQDRMQNLQNLSEGGLAETKKYWQAQMDGAERSSRAFKEAEKNLKAINAEQERLANDQIQKSARRLNRRDLSTMSEQELTESVKAAKQLLANMKPTEAVFKQLQDNIIRAEKHIKEFGLESERSLKAAEEQTRLMNSRMKSLKTLSADALEETRKYWQAQRDGADAGSKEFEKAEKNLKRIDNLIGKRKVKALDEILGDPQHHGVSEVEQAVKEMERLRDSVQKGIPAWQHYNKMVNQGRDYLDQLAKTEAADRVAAQMKNLTQLSNAGLDEVKRYWQAQIDGATRGSQAYADAEAAMKRITSLEQTRQAGQATRVLYRPDRYGDTEIRQAIQAMEQLRDAQAHGSQRWEMYNKRVQEGKQYLEEWAQLDNVIKFEGQMQKLPQLSDAALAETKKFWETMAAGAEKGSQELTQYEAHLERVKQEERDRRQLNDEITSQRLNGNLKTQSEQEIREAIEAAKRLIQTYESAGPEAAALSVKIADAEEHLKKYGLEAERAARREAKAIADAAQKRQESDDLMKQQLQQGASLSKEALKAQEQYWKKLIDDPKTAAASLQDYQQQLDKVRMLQELMMQQRGTDALDRMRNDVDYERKVSPNQIKEDIEAIKALRNSLPQEGNEDVLREIDYYLTQLEGSAKKATQEVMSLDDALELAKKAGDWKGDGFFASPQSIQAATKAIEKQRDSVIQLIQQKRNMGQATNAEEDQLADLTKKLRSLKFEEDNVNMSQEKMRTLIETPANAVNLDELRAAIKRADGQLRQMEQSLGQNSDEYKRFAEQVRNAKNVMKEMEGQAKASATAWEKAVSRIKTYVVLYMGFNELWQKITGTMGDMLELSDKMGEVMKTTQFSADQVARLSDNLKDLDTRTPMVKLMELSSIAGSIGLKTQQQVEGFTDAANQLMVALPEMGTEAARTLMKIADATGDLEKNGGDVRETLERVGSTIIALRANSAAAAGPITDFVSRVGAVGAQAGISIDQIAALGATVDALGGRVEMSATALSRMIPAIRNNSFAVANAIGMTEKELKGMTAMEQMVAIFKALRDSVKQFDTSTDEGMNAMADKVEQMLGNSASMQEVMKTLNQQGARAGIVFGLLSQNVDKLEEQLTTATDAYRDNAALMEEYNKMNDTAAARWERLKNQLEEFWVTADNTSVLAGIIDGLRVLVDFLTEDGPLGRFFRWSLVYLGMWQAGWTKTIGGALISLYQYIFATGKSTAATAADTAAKAANAAATEAQAVASGKAAVAQSRFNATMKANIVAAVATAVVALGFALYEYIKKAKAAARQTDVLADVEKKAREESVKERAELERLYKATQDQTKSMEERKKALKDMVGDAKYKEYYSKLNTESELAKAAASAYKELSEQIIATARARALDAKAEELQRKRIELEDKKTERQQWREENQGNYDAGKREYRRQQDYVGSVTGGATAGFQESQIAQRGSAAAKPAIIDQFEGNIREINKLESDISQVDADLEKVKKQVEGITGIKGDASGDGNGGGGGGGGTNPYGDYNKVTSPYKDWNGNDLVARRKEMLERVKALANGADVQAVLSEDAKFISDAVRKNIKTTEQAIEWYNTERLKIQEALHGKHLTNTGDWMDPEKVRKRVGRVVNDEMKYYLDELDAYYTERKAKIQEAQNDQEISEAEARNRTLANDAEWQQRRAELQLLYSKRRGEVVQQEQDEIFRIISERTGETTAYIKADIAQTNHLIEETGKKNKAAMDRIYGDIELGAERSFLRQRNAIGQHMKDITAIVNKENPYAGITEELRKNLGTMDALLTDIEKEEERTMEKEIERTMFILEQSTKGYSLTWEQLMGEMAKRGWQAWADAINSDTQTQQRLMHQVYRVFEKVQDAIKKEASELKKQADIMWSNILLPGGDGKTTIKDAFEQAIGALGIQEGRVSRANSLIGAGVASERVADKLAIQQLKVQLAMQQYQYSLVHKIGKEKIDMLRREAEMESDAEKARQLRMQAQNAEMALNLATRKEQTDELKLQEDIIAKTEESEARLYKELREWADLLTSSLQGVFEASHAGDAEYYNERAKLNLTGKGGPGAGTYVVIDDAGTSDATAHLEYLDERQALERQHEIEQQNAQAEAWKKVMDDINMKLSETITDQINAMLQNQSIDANTQAVLANTQAIYASMGQSAGTGEGITRNAEGFAVDESGQVISPIQPTEPTSQPEAETPAWKPFWQMTDEEKAKNQENMTEMFGMYRDLSVQTETEKAELLAEVPGYTPPAISMTDEQIESVGEKLEVLNQKEIDASKKKTQAILADQQAIKQGELQTDKTMTQSSKNMYAAMMSAANLYGVAYQAMTNDNLSAEQKFQMIALQAAGQSAIAMMQTNMFKSETDTLVALPQILAECLEINPIAGAAIFAVLSALLGVAIGAATSKLAKGKSEVAQVTGASASAGRLSTGMLTYAEGNVNEFTDPASLTPGRQYNVDGADGKTYRAKYMGKGAKTHITNGPEFHLVGEAGREAIIDAKTTRLLQMNDTGIWRDIQTLYNGGSISGLSSRRRRGGVAAFADGNVGEFEDALGGEAPSTGAGGMGMEQMLTALDRNSAIQEALLERLNKPIVARNIWTGPEGIPNMYNKMQKEAQRHGEKYL